MPPYGLAGGESSESERNNILCTDGSIDVLLGTDRPKINTGDIFVMDPPRDEG